MKRTGRWLVAALVVVAASAAAFWLNRSALILKLIEIRSARSFQVGPNRPVVWDRGPDPLGRPPGERPPNIVVILADDLGWNDLTWQGGGVAGGTVPTPNIDSIARDGVAFTHGYAAHGTCAPSRAAIMTGRYGTRFGFEFTPTPPGMSTLLRFIDTSGPPRLRQRIPTPGASELPFDAMGMPTSEITLAELLAPAGYHSVHIGKWHLGGIDGMAANDQGFDESLEMKSGLYLPEDHPGVVNAKQSFDQIDQFLWASLKFAATWNGSEAFAPERYLTDYYTDQAVAAIDANRDRPFFLYLAHWAPHVPLQATREDYDAVAHIAEHRLRVYAAMIRALDRGVDRVLDALRERGLEENTLVFFTSDNGAPNYIGLPEVNRPLRGWKITLFEGGIRVPYFVKWPARLQPGQTFDAPVHGFDLFATAAAAAGVAVPADRVIDGVDLVPHVLGERAGPPHDRLFWRTGHYQAAMAGGWKLQVNEGGAPGVWLFDLPNDPGERTNLAAREPGRVAALRRLLDAHNAEQVVPRWPSLTQNPINLDKTLLDADQPDDEYVYWPN